MRILAFDFLDCRVSIKVGEYDLCLCFRTCSILIINLVRLFQPESMHIVLARDEGRYSVDDCETSIGRDVGVSENSDDGCINEKAD